MAANGSGFVFGTTDIVRRHELQPSKEPKIQTRTDGEQRSVEPMTEDEKRTEVAVELCQPC